VISSSGLGLKKDSTSAFKLLIFSVKLARLSPKLLTAEKVPDMRPLAASAPFSQKLLLNSSKSALAELTIC